MHPWKKKKKGQPDYYHNYLLLWVFSFNIQHNISPPFSFFKVHKFSNTTQYSRTSVTNSRPYRQPNSLETQICAVTSLPYFSGSCSLLLLLFFFFLLFVFALSVTTIFQRHKYFELYNSQCVHNFKSCPEQVFFFPIKTNGIKLPILHTLLLHYCCNPPQLTIQ